MPCRQYNAIKNSRSLSLGDCRFRKLPHPVTVLRCRPTSPTRKPIWNPREPSRNRLPLLKNAASMAVDARKSDTRFWCGC